MEKLQLGGWWKRSVGGRCIDFVAVPGSYEPLGECTLEREFRWTAADDNAPRRNFLCTEGVLAEAEFTLNGEPVGRAGPWVPYRFEIPPGTLKESNLLVARVSDTAVPFGLTPGRRMDAGLIRDISIECRPAAFISSLQFHYELSPDFAGATCSVAVAMDGAARGTTFEALLEEVETGRAVATAAAGAGRPIGFEVPRPRLWSPESPHLYRLRVCARGGAADGDVATETVGFRRIETRGRDFFLNGKRLVLKGVCRHEFLASHAFSPPQAAVERDLAQIKHAGFNFVRLVHAPPAAVVSRIAARLGLLVSEEPGACFMDLGDERIASAAVESMRRTVLRDRNCPSVFAWLIYNECNPDPPYARRIADAIRELDPSGRPIGMADCSRAVEQVKEMVAAGGLSMYGINRYDSDPNTYVKIMESYPELPLVITEWGGRVGQGNPRTLAELCATFARHAQEGPPARISGSCFWVWQDYPELTRAEPATVDGWTIEGLIDRQGKPRHDLLALSMMCFETDRPSVREPGRPRVMLRGPRRARHWAGVDLERVAGDQAALEEEIAQARAVHGVRAPALGPLLVDGIEFTPRHPERPASPLLIGRGREQAIIPVNRRVQAIAVLGHVDFRAGYPGSGLFSVHTGAALTARTAGQPASEYLFEFDDGTVAQPLRHGEHILRGNVVCRWWRSDPRAPFTRAAVEAVLHPSYEILRIDLWERRFERPRLLRRIRWRLQDEESIQGMFAMSIEPG